MSLRRMALCVNDDMPRVFLPPPCEGTRTANFRASARKHLKYISLSFAFVTRVIVAYMLGFRQET